ncbi:hypothetical protein POTOM_059643 [Populus tomentosa]|uniref:Wound-responsive family protein n=1 Tax=Populus tomentosa TaxID=118781 RepID=A0A8X8C390_POPTO|nr:hypothetical protein POTOM_059643 [Populus tomentosa]
MSSASKAWLVAAAVGGVEALKDQGFCRWNYTLRSLHQHAKNHVRPASQAKKLSSSSSAIISNKIKEVTAKQSEESLRKVMYLSCWEKMSSASKAWLVAAAIGGVEALKDQGFCRWNYTLRSLHQHAKNHVGSISQANKKLPYSSSAIISSKFKEEKTRQSEESLRKVMYLSCWGPN